MSNTFEELKKRARSLSAAEKAALARVLIEELDTSTDPHVEQLWIEEAQRRYDAYVAGRMPARPGDAVMSRARNRLR